MIVVDYIELPLYVRQLALSPQELADELARDLHEVGHTFSVERIANDRIGVTYYA